MIGETITGSKRNRHAWLMWMFIGGLFAAGNFAMRENHLLVFSLVPFMIGFAVLMSGREPLIFRFDEEGIEVLSPHFEFIPYRDIEALTVGDEPGQQASIGVLHRTGALYIPTDIDEESRRVYRFLRRAMPEEPAIGPPPSLRSYLREQDDKFGETHVFAYRALARPRIAKPTTGVFVSASLFVVALVWILIGSAEGDYRPWLGVGVLTAIGALVAFMVMLASRSSSGNGKGDGGIVIAPGGIAVEKDNLLGSMRWDEITQIERNRVSYAVEVHFHGGKLTLGDIYHRSLRTIYNRLLDYWEGPLESRY